MIKVLNITEEGRGGGALFRIITVERALRGDVHTIVLGPKNPKNFQDRLKSEAIEYKVIQMYSLSLSPLRLILYFLNFIPEVYAIVRIIKSSNPDIIHVNGSWQIKGIIASWITKRPAIWHLNDTHQHALVKWFFSKLSFIPKGFIYASNRTKDYYSTLISNFKRSTHSIIPAPITLPEQSSIRSYDNSNKRWRGLMIGYINRNKGIEHILRGSKELRRFSVDIDIVGPVIDTQKSYWQSLHQLKNERAASNISFLGYKTTSEDLFENYDFYLCSSNHESSPIAVWEAMAHGLPVISMDVGDVRNVIEQYRCGVLIESFDYNGVIQGVEEFVQLSGDTKSSMSKGAISAAQEIFDISKIKKEYILMYRRVVGES